MSIFDQALHIPAERLLFEPQRAQHQRVLLPLAARLSPRFVAAVALAGFAALACLCMGVEMVMSRDSGGGALLFASGFIVASALPTGIAFVGVMDVLKPAPQLVIDAEGLKDARLGNERILWCNVVAAELVAAASGVNAVRLTLEQDGRPRFNPFRIGGWSADWRQRRRVRTIALMLLDVRAHALAHTILLLAARGGARVEMPAAPPWPI